MWFRNIFISNLTTKTWKDVIQSSLFSSSFFFSFLLIKVLILLRQRSRCKLSPTDCWYNFQMSLFFSNVENVYQSSLFSYSVIMDFLWIVVQRKWNEKKLHDKKNGEEKIKTNFSLIRGKWKRNGCMVRRFDINLDRLNLKFIYSATNFKAIASTDELLNIY